MPIVGSGNALALARKTAKDSVGAKWRSMNRVLSPAEIDQMKLEIEQADSAAIIAHFVALTTVTGEAGPPGALPVLGVLT